MAEVLHKHQIDGGELLIGCGHNRKKRFVINDENDNPGPKEFQKLTTLDVDPGCNPDYVWNLEHMPLPFEDNCFDEIHAYEVLEHLGQQGNYRQFFQQFEEFHRILKPNGLFYGTVPMWDSQWAWGDPGHTRVITTGTLVFLQQASYSGLGETPMTDYRHCYNADFKVLVADESTERLMFVLKALK